MADGFLSWTYSGVDFQLAGNGGEKCASFIPRWQRFTETVVMLVVSFLEMYLSFRHLVLPTTSYRGSRQNHSNHRPVEKGELGRRVLLVILCLVFGIELGFKFATRQLIWLLNPCHVVTLIQIFILTAPPSRLVQAIFRVHLHLLSGATIALVFPVINTRLLTFEKEVYFIQHGLLLVIPAYLMSLGGVYTVEPLSNPYWMIFSLGLKFFYHFSFLQFVGQISLVNLNSMLCPAVSDPFYGPYYRCFACLHQTALIVIHGKIYTFLVQIILRAVSCSETETAPVVQNGAAVRGMEGELPGSMREREVNVSRFHVNTGTGNAVQGGDTRNIGAVEDDSVQNRESKCDENLLQLDSREQEGLRNRNGVVKQVK